MGACIENQAERGTACDCLPASYPNNQLGQQRCADKRLARSPGVASVLRRMTEASRGVTASGTNQHDEQAPLSEERVDGAETL